MGGSRAGIRIGGVVLELAVVFVGVLIALGVNSWWSARVDRESLRANLEVLALDMDEAADALLDAIRHDSANVVFYRDVHDGLLANDAVRYRRLLDPPEAKIRIAPVPLGTLRFLVSGGGVRLIENADVRGTLIGSLSTIELVQGWMDDLAAEGRQALESVRRAEDASAVSGTPWPDSAVRNADVVAALTQVSARLENIEALQRRILDLVREIESAARSGISRP